MPLVVGITGAPGVIFGIELLKVLDQTGIEHNLFRRWGRRELMAEIKGKGSCVAIWYCKNTIWNIHKAISG